MTNNNEIPTDAAGNPPFTVPADGWGEGWTTGGGMIAGGDDEMHVTPGSIRIENIGGHALITDDSEGNLIADGEVIGACQYAPLRWSVRTKPGADTQAGSITVQGNPVLRPLVFRETRPDQP